MSGRQKISGYMAIDSLPYTILQLAGTYNIWRVLGGTPTQITPYVDGVDFPEEMNNALLSPDGTKIVYNENFPGPNGEGQINMVAANGGTPSTLSPDDAGGPWMIHPSWGPNSDRVVYIHADPAQGFNGSIVEVLLSAPGSETVLYTPAVVGTGGHGPYRPQYSRDGTMIAFVLNAEAGGSTAITGLWVMNSDGTSPTNIDNFTSGYGFDGSQFAWGPNNEIVYWNSDDEQVYMIQSDGSGLTLLSTDGETSTQLCRVSNRAWVAGDGYIVISSKWFDGSFHWVPYRMELDGSGGTRLNDTKGPYDDQNFTNVYVHTDNRIYFIEDIIPGIISSLAIGGTDYRVGQDVTDNSVGDEFYAGTGIEWI